MKKIGKFKLRLFWVFLLTAGSAVFSLQPANSQSDVQDGSPPDLQPVGNNADTQDTISRELSLDDVTELALRNSLDIQIARFDAYMERTSLEDAESIFDTFLKGEVSYQRDKKMQPSVTAGNQDKKVSYSVGLEKKLPTGTTVYLDATSTRNDTDSAYVTLNPYHEALAEISLVQELGKNFFGLADRAEIKITKIDIENSDFTSLDDIEDALYQAQRAYWNFVLKETELEIAEDMLKQAEKLYAIYQDKYSLGLAERSDFLAVEALVYARKSEIEVARLAKETEKNSLLFLINRGDFQEQITPKENLVCLLEDADLIEALREAIENRRDYKQAENNLRKNGIEIVVKKNALWPQIDLEATYSRNNLNSERRQAWEDIGQNSNDEVAVKVNFKFPLENREAKAALKKVTLEKKKLLLELKKTEREILRQINDKVNRINTLRREVELYEFTTGLHQEKLNEQVKRVNYGRSNSDTLITYEEDLLKARLKLAAYRYEYRLSLIELALAQNTLLDEYWREPL